MVHSDLHMTGGRLRITTGMALGMVNSGLTLHLSSDPEVITSKLVIYGKELEQKLQPK